MERIARRWKSLSQEEVRRIRNASSVEQYATGGLAGGQYMPCLLYTSRFSINHCGAPGAAFIIAYR